MNKLIGIEISGNTLTMVQAKSGGAAIVSARLPEGVIENGNIMAPDILAKFIRDTKKAGKFTGNACALILPEDTTYFRMLNSPAITEAQLKLNLPYEFRDFVGSEGKDYYYDYAVEATEEDEDGKPKTYELLAAATLKTNVTVFSNIFKHAGLKLKLALPREAALIQLLKQAGTQEERCLVEIGYDRTHVYISEGGTLRAAKVIEIGAKQIDESIAAAHNIDPYLAYSWREENYQNVLNSADCTSVYERIALEVMKTVNFYKYENQQTVLSTACFAGVGASIDGLVKSVLDYVLFEKQDLADFLPAEFRADPQAALCVIPAGLVL